MAGVVDKVDHTANLPDELLHKVFSGLSLRDKLRIESVSHRFQRCVLALLKIQPQPLVLSLSNKSSWTSEEKILLNGYRAHQEVSESALRAFCTKSKFSEVRLGVWLGRSRTEQTDALLSILLETECLDKVVSFVCVICPSQDIMEQFLARCAKLSNLKFNGCLDLSSILRDKALAQLDLEPCYPQEELVELFHSLKPHALKKLKCMMYPSKSLDLASMATELSVSAWAALQEIHVTLHNRRREVQLAEFIDSLVLLRALKTCHIQVDDIRPNHQFVDRMISLFNSGFKITLTETNRQGSTFGQMAPCQIMAGIRQIQNTHRDMRVDFALARCPPESLTLSLSAGTRLYEIARASSPTACPNAHCLDCHRFYPHVRNALASQVDRHVRAEDTHLEEYQLDKCRVEKVVQQLNPKVSYSRAVSAQINEAQDLVTITLAILPAYSRYHQRQHYTITVGCGPCFSRSCIRCIDI